VIYPLQLEQGPATLRFERSVYFEKLDHSNVDIIIGGDESIAVAFGPPTLDGQFSDGAVEVNAARRIRQRRSSQPDATTIAIPPPLGMRMVERYPSPDQRRIPRAFSPDVTRISQDVARSLLSVGADPIILLHPQIIDYEQKIEAKLALQLSLVSSERIGESGNEETFFNTFLFKLIDVENGQLVWKSEVTGQHKTQQPRRGNIDCNDVFYQVVDNAIGQLTNSEEFLSFLRSY
jgi:hypothetical protein